MNFSDALTIVQIVITLPSIIFAAIQLLFLAKETQYSTKWNKMNNTFLFLDTYNQLEKSIDIELLNRLSMLKFDKSNINHAYFSDLLDDNSKRQQLLQIMRFYESLSFGILCNYYDETVAKEQILLRFVAAYYALKPYIDIRRREASSDMLGIHFEKLAKRWDIEKLYSNLDTQHDQ